MLAAPGSESIREAEKVLLVDGVHHLDRRALDNLVLQRGDAERSLPPVGLGDVDPARWSCSVRSLVQPLVQGTEVILQAGRVLHPRHTVDSSRCRALQRKEGVSEPIDREMVEERRELRLPVLSCRFAYTVQRTWRAAPALRPGRVLLVRVPLGQA